MAQKRSISWLALAIGLLIGVAVAGIVVWCINLGSLDARISRQHKGLKKMLLSGRIPPNQEVMDYVELRQESVEKHYEYWKGYVIAKSSVDSDSADIQLHFEQQFHEVQRTLERLAAAREMDVPDLLGFPEDLPPTDTVPRLLVQLTLIEEMANLMMEQDVYSLSSLKVEDPQMVPVEDEDGLFLMRLPIRVRFSDTLPQMMSILSAIQITEPIIDIRSVRIIPPEPSEDEDDEFLDVYLLLSRYLMLTVAPELVLEDKKSTSRRKRIRTPRKGKDSDDEEQPKSTRRRRRKAKDKDSEEKSSEEKKNNSLGP